MTFADTLLAWYAGARRPLPWRGETDPWRILVSEIMLQQTQVATVEPYYARFLARFPTLAALADAPLDDLLELWQGLGYYRRARGLHALARLVAAEHGGALPADAAALRALPGIGEYTAGAVASIAFGERVAAVDGNAERVLSRVLALPGDPRQGAARAALRAAAAEMVPAQAPGDFNQALMELGATLCRPEPRCDDCPVSRHCRARASGAPTDFPRREPAKAPRRRVHVAAYALRGDAFLLGQRPAEGRWGGLWELPRVELEPEADAIAGLRDGLAASLGVRPTVGARLAALRHAVSGESIELVAYAATLPDAPRPLGYAALRWVSDVEGLALPTPQRRLLARIRA